MPDPPVRRYGVALSAVVFFSAAAVAYFSGLVDLTPFASPDEVLIGLFARSIRTSAHDGYGRLLPLYFEVPPKSWYQPMAVYAEAAMQLIRPFNLETLRIPSVVIGLANVLLMWKLLARWTGSALIAASGALVLVSAPAHFVHSRLALDYIYPLPFIAAWLYAMVRFDQSRDRAWLRWGVTALGIGMFSYASAVVLMPALMLLTAAAVVDTTRDWRSLSAIVPGALAPALLIGVWVATHPEMVSDTIARYTIYDTHLTPLQGAREFFSYPNVTRKLALYGHYLDPRFVFMDAAGPSISTVRGWGLVLPAAMPLCAIGVWASRESSMLLRSVVIGGVLLSALPAVLVDEPGSAQRVLPMLPFLAVLAALGVQWLWNRAAPQYLLKLLSLGLIAVALLGIAYAIAIFVTQGRLSGSAVPLPVFAIIAVAAARYSSRLPLGRIVATIALVLIAMQFGQFRSDYRSDYNVRFRDLIRGDLPRGLNAVIEHAGPAPVYLNAYVTMIREYWQFATLAAARSELLTRTIFFEPQTLSIDVIPAGSLILARDDDAKLADAYAAGRLELIQPIDERDGRIVFTLYRRR
jgi:hypothetical protein